MNTKRVAVALAVLAALFSSGVQQADACTRATYIGPDNIGCHRSYNGLERRYNE